MGDMGDMGDMASSVMNICIQAGQAIEQARIHGFEAEYKDGDIENPVTAADQKADSILSSGLLGLLPGSNYFGEESVQDGDANSGYSWIVDPLDGTKEFIAGIPEYVVSVLLQKNGYDELAVIYNPSTQTIISGSNAGIFINGEKCTVSERDVLSGAKALASRTEIKAGEWDQFSDLNIVTTGSVAWKCALVAAGLADLTFTLRPRHVWDVGAGFALVRWAGGHISNNKGKQIVIKPTHTKVRCFLASNSALHSLLVDRIKEVPLGPDRRN